MGADKIKSRGLYDAEALLGSVNSITHQVSTDLYHRFLLIKPSDITSAGELFSYYGDLRDAVAAEAVYVFFRYALTADDYGDRGRAGHRRGRTDAPLAILCGDALLSAEHGLPDREVRRVVAVDGVGQDGERRARFERSKGKDEA